MSDLIERKTVIDALEKIAELYPWRIPGNRDTYDRYNEAWQDAVCRMETEIEQLPSAQLANKSPKVDKESGELISRAAAIEAVKILLEQTEEDADVKTWNNAIRGAINSIKYHAPSAKPAPCEFCKHNNIADDKVCLMCSAERRPDE